MRLTELKLPLDHSESDLNAAILKRLGIAADELVGYSIFRRSYDARKPSAIVFIYTLDLELKNEAAVLKRLRGDRHLGPTPDTSYHFVAHAPQTPSGPRQIDVSRSGMSLSFRNPVTTPSWECTGSWAGVEWRSSPHATP